MPVHVLVECLCDLAKHAGANAALEVLERPPLLISRNQGYIGVLVDDLVSHGTQEPYRMFTSRAEYRLLLRVDNADTRLTELGRAAGIVGEERYGLLQRKEAAIAAGLRSLRTYALTNTEWATFGFGVKANGERRSAEQILSVPDANLAAVEKTMELAPHGWREHPAVDPPIPDLGRESVEIIVKYARCVCTHGALTIILRELLAQ